jgi:FKBP-type peptidyl-prolyl cis-trans isomerase
LPLACLLQTKGGSFTGDDKDFLKVRLGSNQVILAFEEALRGMKVGGIRRIIVPEVCQKP